MAFLKSAKPDPNAPYAPTPEVLEAATALTAALDAREQLDRAIATNATDRESADEARRTAAAEVERLDLELALETDTAKIATLDRQLTAARMRAQAAASALERATKRQGALYALAPSKDAAIAGARTEFQTKLSLYGRAANEALAAEALDAAQHLIRVLRRGHAAATAIGCLGTQSGFLGETVVPSPASGQQAILGHGWATFADGSRLDLSAAWRADPAAVALADIMGPMSDLRRRVAGHRPFSPPPPPAKPYEVSPANRRSAEESARERAAAEAWAPPKSTWTPNRAEIRYGNRSGHPAGSELNVVADVADAGAALLGGAR